MEGPDSEMAARGCWLRVDVDAVSRNVFKIKQQLEDDVKLMAVLKAEAYGYGAGPVAEAAVSAGADYLGVSHLKEGVALRKHGIEAPILILNPIKSVLIPSLIEHRLMATIDSLEEAREISQAALQRRTYARVHVVVESGLTRFGLAFDKVEPFLQTLGGYPGLKVEGLYTHFGHTSLKQVRPCLNRFQELDRRLREVQLRPQILHAASSSTAFRLPETQMDMARIGTLIYGMPSCRGDQMGDKLENPGRLESRILRIKDVEAGESIGYDGQFTARSEMRVGVIPVGYSDGFGLDVERPIGNFRSGFSELIRRVYHFFKRYRQPLCAELVKPIDGLPDGDLPEPEETVKLPVVGRIGMQHCIVDLTDYPEIDKGARLQFNTRRVLVARDIPRIYISGGNVTAVSVTERYSKAEAFDTESHLTS